MCQYTCLTDSGVILFATLYLPLKLGFCNFNNDHDDDNNDNSSVVTSPATAKFQAY